MGGRRVILAIMMSAAITFTDAAHAQLSPRSIIGGITRPFREMLGRFGHFPRYRNHTIAAEQPRDDAASHVSSADLGQAGPPAWPSAFEDVIGYTFSPDEYAQELRGHGFDVIADTITGHFVAMQPQAKTAATTGTAVQDDASNEAPSGSCNTSLNRNNWPAARIEQLMQLKDAQHEALDKLQAAVNQSAATINGDCRNITTLEPPDRLKMLIETIWIVRDGGNSVHAPLKNFLDTLDDTQKATFIGQQPQEKRAASAGSANSGGNKQNQACAAPNVEAAERMIREIEQRVRPNKEQAGSLENFHKESLNMAKLLMASCALPTSADPLARIDSADDQLTSMNYAATTVQIAFDDFYGKLDKGQKARLESAGR